MTKSVKIGLAVILAVALVLGLTGFVGAWAPKDVVAPTEEAAKKEDGKGFKKIELDVKPLPEGIMPVYVLSGSDYEIGYLYGYQAAAAISAHLDIKLESFARAGYGETTKTGRDYVLAGFHQYLERDTPEIVDQLRGMADGATAAGYPIDYADAVMLQWCTYAMRDAKANPDSRLDPGDTMPKAGKSRVPENYYAYNPSSSEVSEYLATLDMMAADCCTQCASTGTISKNAGETLVASAWDWHYRYMDIKVIFPEDGNAYVISGKIGSMGEGQWMNSAGCAAMFD